MKHVRSDWQQGRAPARTATDARQGTKLGVMRYVLGISVVLAIIAMGAGLQILLTTAVAELYLDDFTVGDRFTTGTHLLEAPEIYRLCRAV